MNAQTLGVLVKSRREELRVDQRTLASLAGVAVHTLSNIEVGRANPTLGVVTRLLDVLGLELAVKPRTKGSAP